MENLGGQGGPPSTCSSGAVGLSVTRFPQEF